MTKNLSYREGLKKLNDSNIVVTFGDENFYKDQIKNKLKLINKESNYVKLDGSELDYNSVLDELKGFDLFEEDKLFHIKNFTEIKKIENIFKEDFKGVLLLEASKNLKKNITKAFSKDVLAIDCAKPKEWAQEEDAVNKIKSFLNKKGYSYDSGVCELIYSKTGYDLYRIMTELQKIDFCKNDDNISQEDINSICVDSKDKVVFDLIDLIISGKKSDSLQLLDDLIENQKVPCILLINLWNTHFENILYVKTKTNLCDESYKYIKYPKFLVGTKLIPQAKKLSSEKIVSSLDTLTEINKNLRKGSFDPKFHLENFIINF